MRSSGAVGTLSGKGGRPANASEDCGDGEWSECGMLRSVVGLGITSGSVDAFSKYLKWTEVDTSCRCGRATSQRGVARIGVSDGKQQRNTDTNIFQETRIS